MSAATDAAQARVAAPIASALEAALVDAMTHPQWWTVPGEIRHLVERTWVALERACPSDQPARESIDASEVD